MKKETYSRYVDMSHEIWKHIEGLPYYYEASNYGRIRTTDHYSINGHMLYGHFLAQHETTDGYLAINHSISGVATGVHNLVARAFFGIPEDKNLCQVNHKDENKHNNRVNNLEWCTHAYNVNYGNRVNHQQQTMAKRGYINKKFLHGFYIININSKSKKLYFSTMQCARDFNLNHLSILDCLSTRKKHSFTSKGYTFCFADDYYKGYLNTIHRVHKNGVPVKKLKAVNKKTGKVILANTQKELADKIGSSNGNISMVLHSPYHHTVKGYTVSYIN